MSTQISSYLRRCCVLILTAALILFGVFTVNLQPVHAATTWTVNTLTDDAAGGTCSTTCTLRDAIHSATNGDTIQFQSGIIGTIKTGSAGTLSVTTSVTINGPGASNLTIDGSDNGGNSIFAVYPGSTATISGLTIANAFTSGNAGAIYNSGTLTISNSILSENTATNRGGGIFNTFLLTVNNSTFSGNSTAGSGGGIENGDTLIVNNSTFSDNKGSGIASGGTLIVSNSTFSGNSASSGGGIYSGGPSTVSNSTFSNNSATGFGGGIYSGGTLTLLSDIVANDTTTGTGRDVYSAFGPVASAGYNLIGDGTASGIAATTGDQIGTSASPIDPLLGTLANNGGPAQTLAITSGSPAYRKGYCGGNTNVIPGAPVVTTDERGQRRKGTTIGCDVGAYELPHTPITLIVTTIADDAAGGNCGMPCTLRDALNSAQNGDTIQFQSGVTGTITTNTTLAIGNSITINGPGANSLTIDGSTNGHQSIFIVNVGVIASISGLTIANADTSTFGSGGGIYNHGGTLTVSSSVFLGNSASQRQGGGGGIFNDGGTVTVNGSNFTGNAANGSSTNGNSDGGGGIYNNSGTLTISNSTFSGNSTNSNSNGGGGIYDTNGTLTISNSTFLNNSTNGINGGGGIYSYSAALTISNSTFSNNSASGFGGGGILTDGGTLTISDSMFSNNSAIKGAGGGIENSGPMTLINSTFSNNSAGSGGGIENSNDPLMISNCTFSSNSASGGGGGGVENYGILTVNNSTFSGNTAASNGGGGIFDAFGTLTISNSTFSNNSAVYYGGGIALYGDQATATISNSTISGNSANYAFYGGGGIYNEGTLKLLSDIVAKNTTTGTGPDVSNYNSSSTVASVGYNLIGDGTSSGMTPANGDHIGTSANPIDPLLGTLANNGGSTQTLALLASSPAINKGNCAGYNTITPHAPAVTVDQRGVPRKASCDVGAFEYIVPKIDTIGIFRSGTFYLRLHNTTGNADLTVGFTAGTKPYPIVGDWTGAGFDTVGVYDQSNGQFSLRNTNTPGLPDKQFVLGNPNDQPLSGRWMLSAVTAGVGVFRPSNGLIYLKNGLATGYADFTMVLGIPGDMGLAGDWNGKGFDSPGVYRPGNSTFYLSNQVINGSVFGDYTVHYGVGGDSPVAGDWTAQGHDGIGLFRQSNGFTYLKNQLVTGYADNTFTYGIAGDVPIAGHWQVTYPPTAPTSILIARTPISTPNGGSVPGGNQIGG